MSITSDLTQALQCAGKCDCCQKLQNQINALEAKFNNYALKSSLDNYLLKNEKPTIINEAYYKMEGYVTPKFALVDNELDGLTIVLQGLVITIAAIKATIEGLGTQIANFITWVRLEISKLWDWISSQIKKLEAKNYDSEIAELRRLINEANNNAASAKTEVKEIRPISEKAYELAQSVNNELLKFKDSVRSALEGLRTELKKDIDYVTERALAAMQRLQTRIENVEPVAKQGLDLAGTANNKAIDAKSKADRGYSLAESAKFKAEESLGRADAAYAEATEAIGKANNANNRAIDAKSKAEEALGRADAAYQEVTDIKPKLSAVETRVTDTNRRIDGLDGEVSSIKSRLGTVESDIPNIKGRIDSVEGKIPTQISTQVATQVPPVVVAVLESAAPPKIEEKVRSIFGSNPSSFTQSDFTPKVNQNTNDINDIKRRLGDAEKVNAEGNRKLDEILAKLPANNGSAIAGTAIAGTINAFLTDPRISSKLQSAAATGACQTMQPGGCGDNAIKRNNGDLLSKLGGGLDAAAQAAQTALLTKIDGKLGAEIVGGLSGWMTRFSKWSVTGQVMQYFTFAVTLHNAIQLSTNIGTTLIQVIQNVVDLIGSKDSDDNPFNVQEIIGKSINSFVELAIGKENIANFKSEWAKYSRIYQAGGNLFSSLMSMGDTMVNAVQIVSGQNAKIGNALKVWGVVGEKAYGWMNITPNFSNPLLTKLQSLEETASTVEQVSQEPLNVKSAKEQLETSSKELFDSLEQKEDKRQGKELPEANKVKEAMDKAKEESKGVDKTLSDAYEDDDE